MADGTRRGWRELCVAVTSETDSEKLDSLVQDLIRALDEGEREWRCVTYSNDAVTAHHQGAKEVLYG